MSNTKGWDNLALLHLLHEVNVKKRKDAAAVCMRERAKKTTLPLTVLPNNNNKRNTSQELRGHPKRKHATEKNGDGGTERPRRGAIYYSVFKALRSWLALLLSLSPPPLLLLFLASGTFNQKPSTARFLPPRGGGGGTGGRK